MAKPTPEAFHAASRCPALASRVPAVKEINGEVAYELWQATLSNHQAWPKEKIFMAALGIALQLSRDQLPAPPNAPPAA